MGGKEDSYAVEKARSGDSISRQAGMKRQWWDPAPGCPQGPCLGPWSCFNWGLCLCMSVTWLRTERQTDGLVYVLGCHLRQCRCAVTCWSEWQALPSEAMGTSRPMLLLRTMSWIMTLRLPESVFDVPGLYYHHRSCRYPWSEPRHRARFTLYLDATMWAA